MICVSLFAIFIGLVYPRILKTMNKNYHNLSFRYRWYIWCCWIITNL